MRDRGKSIFLFFLVIFFLPMLQKALPFVKSAPLVGEFRLAPDTEFTWKKWFDGSYMTAKASYVNDNMGFRPDFIRLTDQIDYSMFKKIHSEWRLFGENSCIFQDVYIYSYLGRDFDGYPAILEKVRKLKAIQDTLQKLGKSLIFVQTPCKAFYYPEYFPEKFKNVKRGPTNFETYKRIADSLGVNQVDFNTWFVSMKDTSKGLLYPKQGFHWSVYGSLIAADSLVKYMERLRNIKMIHPAWNKIVHTEKPRDKDDDIAQSMNLIFPFVKETFSYPDVTYVQDKNAVKPRIIYIGDSFLFQWLDEGVLDNVNSTWQIWYYNSLLINKTFTLDSRQSLDNYDSIQEIDKADCIVIMFTSRNLSNLGNNFIERTYAHFFSSKL